MAKESKEDQAWNLRERLRELVKEYNTVETAQEFIDKVAALGR